MLVFNHCSLITYNERYTTFDPTIEVMLVQTVSLHRCQFGISLLLNILKSFI